MSLTFVVQGSALELGQVLKSRCHENRKLLRKKTDYNHPAIGLLHLLVASTLHMPLQFASCLGWCRTFLS
jgi:hypothetical protein